MMTQEIKPEFKSNNIRSFFIKNNARIEELMRSGNSVKCTYYTLISDGLQAEFTLDGFRKAMKRYRPDLHQLIAYGNKRTLLPVSSPATEQESHVPGATVIQPATRAWKHNKTPDEALFQKSNKD